MRGLKRDLYEGGIRVPLIARWPGRIKAGQVNDDPWAFWDFLPTAADLAGAPVPANLDGLSMLPTLLGQTQTNRHEFLYWEFHERGFQQAVRMGDWKALCPQPGQPLELYNLKSDLGEQHNVAAQNPEVVAKIEEYLKTARTDSDLWPIKQPAPGPSRLQNRTAQPSEASRKGREGRPAGIEGPEEDGDIVAQVSNLLYRRLPVGRAAETRKPPEWTHGCGLEIRDTADLKSALRWLRFWRSRPFA